MTKWVLSPSVALRLDAFEKSLKEQGTYETNAMFVRGGYWRNFFAKYPESNHMHKKMLRVSEKMRKAFALGSTPPEILDDIWAGQCNDPYWHGLFGGLYLPNLRFPVYRSLLKAETAIERTRTSRSVTCESYDFDCDGSNELVVESTLNDLCFKPDSGGCLVELSFRPGAVNLLDILSRREEYSHRRLLEAMKEENAGQGWDGLLAKEKDLHKHIFFDWYRHASLLDHFFDETADLAAFAACQHREIGDFINQPYGSTITKDREHVEIELSRQGAVWKDGIPHRLLVTKKIVILEGEAGFTAHYEVSNLEDTPIECRFGIEFALGGMAGDAPDRYVEVGGSPIVNSQSTIDNRLLGGSPADRRLRSQGEVSDVLNFRATDEWMRVASCWELSQLATLWRFPLETVSLSESGFERLYQGTIFLPFWNLRLGASGQMASQWKVSVKQVLSQRES